MREEIDGKRKLCTALAASVLRVEIRRVDTARWWPLKNLPERLAFDHADTLSAAVVPIP